MTVFRDTLDPILTLSDRLQQLRYGLYDLGQRLRDAVVSLLSRTVGETLRDWLRCRLGAGEEPTDLDMPAAQRPVLVVALVALVTAGIALLGGTPFSNWIHLTSSLSQLLLIAGWSASLV